MATFTGQLNVNHIQSALYNMIIAQDIIGGSIKANYNLVDQAKENAGLYGDTKLYIDTPVLTPVDWVQDSAEMINVLKLHRPDAPKTQALVINVFKQVALTKDDYLSKQAFGTEGAFVQYQSVLESRLNKSKEVYLNKTYNTFIGNVAGEETVTVDLTAGGNSAGENMAYAIANLVDDMKDYNTKYTANGFERAFGEDQITIIWNNEYINAIRKIDLPSIFHNEALESAFVGKKLPARYFGEANAHTTSVSGDRATHDLYLQTTNPGDTYVAAGDAIPAGLTIKAGDAYTVDEDIICKVITRMPPMLEAFSVGTSFFNAKNLSTNFYLTFGHSTLEALKSEAIVTIKKASA